MLSLPKGTFDVCFSHLCSFYIQLLALTLTKNWILYQSDKN